MSFVSKAEVDTMDGRGDIMQRFDMFEIHALSQNSITAMKYWQ